MKLIDYILFINHTFLLILKNINNDEIEERSKNALVFMIYFIALLLSSIPYGLCLSLKIISYNKYYIFFIGILLFLIIRYLVFRRYKYNYNDIIERQTIRYTISKNKIIICFLLFWFIPIFVFWLGMIVLRSIIF